MMASPMRARRQPFSPPSETGTFKDPMLIVDELSASNETETWKGIWALTGLASLKESLVVQSTAVDVPLFRRDTGGAWPSEAVAATAGGSIGIESIKLELAVAEIYRGTMLAG